MDVDLEDLRYAERLIRGVVSRHVAAGDVTVSMLQDRFAALSAVEHLIKNLTERG